MKTILSIVVLCISFLVTPLFAQAQNDSLFRYSFTPQSPKKSTPVLIDAYHNTIFNPNRQNPAATEAMLDILTKELGPVIFIQEAILSGLLDKYPESTLIIKGLPNDRVSISEDGFYWKSPLKESEVDAIVKWIHNGGNLMMFLSHFPNGSGGKPLLEALSIKFRDGYIYHGDYPGGSEGDLCSWFGMNIENGLINTSHPIFTSTSLEVVNIGFLCGAGIFRNPEDVILSYPDNSANMTLNTDGNEYISAEQSGQYAAMLGFEFGKGKVIVSGDQGLFRNNKITSSETGEITYITINDPEVDNGALLINLLRWIKD